MVRETKGKKKQAHTSIKIKNSRERWLFFRGKGLIPKGWENFVLWVDIHLEYGIQDVKKNLRDKMSHFHFAYTIVAPHSPHGGDAFDDDNDGCGASAAKLCVEESTILVWTIGVFVESVVVDGKIGLCTLSGAGFYIHY